MAAKGTIAKENVAKAIANAFGSNYLGEYDKKYYVWSEENGEKVQVAISMTCPKTPIGNENFRFESSGDSLDFEKMSIEPITSSNTHHSVEISDDERKNIADLMARLGL